MIWYNLTFAVTNNKNTPEGSVSQACFGVSRFDNSRWDKQLFFGSP